jgi:WXXGXW repeat (2 copies)
MNKGPFAGMWVVVAFAGLLEGCVIETVPAPIGVAVGGPPPAPVVEARPAPLVAQSVWIPGYWHWTGMQYTWIPGHWEAGPPGARWRAPRYPLRDGVYYYEPGGWGSPGR